MLSGNPIFCSRLLLFYFNSVFLALLCINNCFSNNTHNATKMLPNITYIARLNTNWNLSSNTVASAPSVLLPGTIFSLPFICFFSSFSTVGRLRHAWSFEQNYTEPVRNIDPTGVNNRPAFAPGVCGQVTTSFSCSL